MTKPKVLTVVHNATGKSLGAYVKTTPRLTYVYRTSRGVDAEVRCQVVSLLLR